MSSLVLRKVS